MNIVITGASKGIGYETALFLASMEENIVFAVSRDGRGLKALSDRTDQIAGGHKLVAYPFDLTSGKIESRLVPEILSCMPGVDILINNAGTLINKPFMAMKDTDYDSVFNTNLKSAIQLIRALVPHMNRGGHIVNIGSMGGFQGSSKFKGLSLYSASKAAMACLSECLAVELAETGIRVNCLALGAADTEMFRTAFPGYQAPVSAGEMARFVAGFAMTGHQFFNGKILPVSNSTP